MYCAYWYMKVILITHQQRKQEHEQLLLSRNAMLVCILSNIKYAVILCVFVRLCSVTDITATVTPIGIKFCTMVHICHGHKVSP